ncbi:uncharacterized protein LOC108288072 [Cebus imitator]|uniref:uncharacterized protein LOC108288072 n=1 Tax=Cebus imitator TaxID=2715852 RepID=UPI001898F31E|nr:uncharacterized protein LOC108288072 [Cebus imitator]
MPRRSWSTGYSSASTGRTWSRRSSCHPSNLRSRPRSTDCILMINSPPSPSHPPTAMTAWAHWSWNSGHTSPNSPTRPATGREQSAHAQMHPRCHHRRVAFFPLTLYFAFLVSVPTSHLLTCFPVLQVLPRRSPTAPAAAAFPASSLTFVPVLELGRLHLPPRPGLLGAGDIQFYSTQAPVRGEAWHLGPAWVSGPGAAPVAASALLFPEEARLPVGRLTRQTVVLPSRPEA